MVFRLNFLPCVVFVAAFSATLAAQTQAPPPDSKAVATVDAGLGPCTADFTINDEAGEPVYAAKIRIHVTYGFLNLHKLDLEAGTNSDGKASFQGLPHGPRQGLFFRASEGDREGSAFDDPSKTCKAQFTIVLRKKIL